MTKKLAITVTFLLFAFAFFAFFASITGFIVFPGQPKAPGLPPADSGISLVLVSPQNNAQITNANRVEFSINTSSDYYEITRCDLIINGKVNQSIPSPWTWTLIKFYVTFSNGDYSWSANCSSPEKQNISATRTFKVNYASAITTTTPQTTTTPSISATTTTPVTTTTPATTTTPVTPVTPPTTTTTTTMPTQPSCTNDCSPSGNKTCSQNGYKTCGNYDADDCLEWSTKTSCSATQYCMSGVCVNNQTSTPLVTSTPTQTPATSTSALDLVIDNKKFGLSKNGSKLVDFSYSGNLPSIDTRNYIINSGSENDKSFMIVKVNTEKEYTTKTIYLNMKSDSPGVCLKDADVDSTTQIKSGCVYVSCPGFKGNYNCTRLDANRVSITGLTHSGVLEMQNSTCGDGICIDEESCSSCSSDCGSCPAAPDSGGPGGGGGSSGGSPASGSPSSAKNLSNSSKSTSNLGGSNNLDSTSQTDSVDTSEETVSVEESAKSAFYLIIVGLIVLVVVVGFALFFIIRRKNSIRSSDNSYSIASPVLENKPNKTPLQNPDALTKESINLKLLRGYNLISSGNKTDAIKVYSEIKTLYGHLVFPDKELYSKILEFYKKLV